MIKDSRGRSNLRIDHAVSPITRDAAVEPGPRDCYQRRTAGGLAAQSREPRTRCRQTVVCRQLAAHHPTQRESTSRTRVEKLRRTDRPIPYFRHVLFGYARVSTADQNPDHQMDALQRAGVARDDIYVDHASGAKASRPELDNVLRLLRDGDTLKITRLDRLGRSVLHLVTLGAELRERGVGLHVIEQGIDTSTAEGRAMFGMLSVLAELQRELIVANTRDGLAAARARGRNGGRRPKLNADQVALAQQLYDAREKTVQQIADLFGVPRTTVYGHLDPNSKGKRPATGSAVAATSEGTERQNE